MNNLNSDVSLSKGVYKDIVSIVVNRYDAFIPSKKENSYINVDINDDTVELNIHVKVKQGKDIVENSKILQSDIVETITSMTGVSIKRVNIDIVGFVK